MIEALITFCVHRILERRKQALEFHADEQCILHLELRAAWVNADTVNHNLPGSSIEILILELTEGSAVYRIGDIRAEIRNIETVCTPTDFLIRCKANADFSMLYLRVRQKMFRHGHNLCDARLIVGAEQRRAIRHDEVLAPQLRQEREIRLLHHDLLLFVQDDISAVVILHNPRLHIRPTQCRRGIHVRDETEHRYFFIACCRNSCE